MPPSTKRFFFSVCCLILSLILSITPERLVEISSLVNLWLVKDKCSLRELQPLLGKLHCVRPGRIFVSHLLIWLRTFPSGPSSFTKKIPNYVKKDLSWWSRFLFTYNSVSMMSLEEWSESDIVMSSDSSLVGCGGISGSGYFHIVFPRFIVRKALHINAL